MRASERRAAIALAVAAWCSACGSGALDPAGREAQRVAGVFWVMATMATVIFVAVLGLLFVALRSDPDRGVGNRIGGVRTIVVGGIVVPALVLSALLGLTLWAGDDLRAEGAEEALRIEVTGHQYWWDVRYPDAGVRTANEIHVPVGEEVLLSLHSDDVIHSVWVPQIAGKLDLVPGRVNRMTLRADEAGVFQGVCAEFCGLQHARMRLEMVAHEPADFDAWLASSSQPVSTPDDPELFEGWQVFMSSACVYCHRIEGTPAASDFGPDLTDVASRRTLGAGTMPNTREALSSWITDPQEAKPGNLMPATPYDPEQLEALIDFLESLR